MKQVFLILLFGFFAIGGGTSFGEDARTDDAADHCLFQGISSTQIPLCIRKDRFNEDLCGVIEQVAIERELPPEFFARLVWRESLFRPEAISAKGAEGIAQFMPSTARQQGLVDSFNVVQALERSSAYLDDLRDRFGNLGFAAIAYNAGEAGLRRFIASGRLPVETRDYVFAITGHDAETWRDRAPDRASPALDAALPFHQACIRLAESRQMSEPVLVQSADWAPWGVQLAAHRRPAVAARLFLAAISRLPSPLNEERALIVRQRGGNFGHRARYAARIGRLSRIEADTLCDRIKGAGTACTVLRNR